MASAALCAASRDVATTAARQVLAELTTDADAKLIDQAITQLPTALAPRRAA